MRLALLSVLVCGAASKLPPVVPAVNLTKYYGRWYQMYDDAIVQDTFENHSLCDTADCELVHVYPSVVL